MIHTAKLFGIGNRAEIDWNSLAFLNFQLRLAIWSLVPLPFLNPAWISGSSRFTYCWRLAWRILSITLLARVAAAAKSLQSCLTLCSPMDYSPPYSTVHGIRQARILKWILKWVVNFQMFKLDLERQRNQRSNCQHPLDHRKSKRIPEEYFCFIDYAKAFDCVDHNKLQTILKEMRIPDFWEICMQDKKLEQDMEQQTCFK